MFLGIWFGLSWVFFQILKSRLDGVRFALRWR